MEYTDLIEVFTLLTGAVFMVMQILQHRWMWYFNILSAAGAVIVAMSYHDDGAWAPLWAQAVLNTYFLVMAAVGIIRWRKWRSVNEAGSIHIKKMSPGIIAASAAIVAIGTPLLWLVLSRTNDPYPLLDSSSFILSFLGAWWLTRSHIEEWFAWASADVILIAIYGMGGYWGMLALYCFYLVSCAFGVMHWLRKGCYVQ